MGMTSFCCSDLMAGSTRPFHTIKSNRPSSRRAMGVREMWLVDTEKKEVEVRSFEADRVAIYKMTDRLSSEVLPTIEIFVTAIFS